MITASFSSDATVRVCERRWFLASVVAHPTANKDPIRRDARLLRQLMHPEAWAGRIIHSVLEELVIPAASESGRLPSSDQLIDQALNLMRRQEEFSRQKLYRSIPKSKAGGDFCALYADEYDGGLTTVQREQVEFRVTTASGNAPRVETLWCELNTAQRLFIEHSFRIRLHGALVEAKPDLVIVSSGRIKIVDWKCWTSLTADPCDQLRFYAYVLLKYWSNHKLLPKDFDLFAVNLLNGSVAPVTCTEEHWDEADDRILEFIERANNILRGRSWQDIGLRNLGIPRSPSTCESCKFRRICRDALPQTREEELCLAF
jgi:hypothetical protein